MCAEVKERISFITVYVFNNKYNWTIADVGNKSHNLSGPTK